MRRRKKKSVALLVDSTIATPLTTVLTQLRPILEKIGDIKVAKIILFQQQAIDYSKDISQEGFLPVIVHDGLDIQFALEAMELVYNEKIESLAVVTENENLLPLFSRARELGKEIILLQASINAGKGLQNVADVVILIGD